MYSFTEAARSRQLAAARATLACSAGALLLLGASCPCLPTPTSDATPPTAGVIVEYREPGGARVSKTLGVGDPDITVQASKGDNVTVVYSGGDEQGVRRADLVYDMKYYENNTVVQPLLAAISTQLDCPKGTVLNSHKFEPDGHPWQFKFSSRATNWVGATAQSGRVTVVMQ